MKKPGERQAQLRDDEEIARELEKVAELVRRRPELNHQAAERLLAIARDIRADAARAAKLGRHRARSSSNEH